jgi:hypothetical protein
MASVAVIAASSVVAAVPASASDATSEATFVSKINAERTARGLAPLAAAYDLTLVARAQSDRMAATSTLDHNPNLATDVTNWLKVAENVGYGTSVDGLHKAFMASSGHAANILDPTVTQVGVGVTWSGGTLWVTEDFRQPTPGFSPPPPPAPVRVPTVRAWLARNSATAGAPDNAFSYGGPWDTTLACDFNGDGVDDLAVYSGGWWAVRTAPGAGPATAFFTYGGPGMKPVCGDWTGTGKDGIGVFDQWGRWFLRDTPTPGAAQREFSYGWGWAQPVVGDWNGDGKDGIGVYDGGYWMLRQSASAGPADAGVLTYGWRGAVAVPGDWDGDGKTTLGVFAPEGHWYVRNSTTPGPAVQVPYGWWGDTPVAGHFSAPGADGLAVTRPAY